MYCLNSTVVGDEREFIEELLAIITPLTHAAVDVERALQSRLDRLPDERPQSLGFELRLAQPPE